MASVVFFRAVNVGGHQKFSPGKLAKDLAAYGVVNIGAAGTFVVRESVSAAVLRKEILERLPFKPELIICPAREVLALKEADPFQDAPGGGDITRYVSVMERAPRPAPGLPLDQPAGKAWEIRIFNIMGRFALSVRRPGKLGIYPNALVEKQCATAATTRNWNTIERMVGEITRGR